MNSKGDNRGQELIAFSYIAVLVLFGALYYVAPSVVAPFVVTDSSALFDWLFVSSVIASTWALWLAMVRQRSVNCYGLWRLLRANLGSASIFFLISATLFVISVVKIDVVIPPESNLMDNKSVNLILNYCRLPILSHPIAIYVLVTAMTYKLVNSPNDYRRAVLIGGIVILVYYFIMYACGVTSSALLDDMLVMSGGARWMLMFIYWVPTALFALAAYVAYSLAFKSD
jgi:hypothetical protein